MNKTLKFFLITLGVLLLLGAIGNAIDPTPKQAAGAATERTSENAIYAAQAAVERHLNNPDAATFPPLDEFRVIEDSLGQFGVLGWVRSTNSFNAIVKTNFVAVVSCDSLGAHWKEVSVEFLN